MENGFLAANITQSIDAGIPVISCASNSDEDVAELTDDYLSDEDCSGFKMDED